VAVSLPIVLVFSATDPSGGAGLQADLLTLSSMGCHALSVVTAITIQDTQGVEDMQPIDPEWIAGQARCILEDARVAVFKIGLIGSVEAAAAIAEVIADYPDIPLILDPVLASGRGDGLASAEVITAMRELLIPRTTLLTPNSIEARRLAKENDGPEDIADLGDCAARFLALGCRYVLVTGTHENTAQVVNTLYDARGSIRTDSWPRLPGDYHGSGCTLASACAAAMANGADVPNAVRDAQEFTWQTLKQAYRVGSGQSVPDRLFWARSSSPSHEPKIRTTELPKP
jgi:hydroxymethylpyrimidine/phosphomethylpyrimidine kinase